MRSSPSRAYLEVLLYAAWLSSGCCAGEGSVLADRRLVITTIGLLVVLPMCFPRDLGALAWVSMAAVGHHHPALFPL